MSKIKSKMRIGLKRILSVFLMLLLVQAAVPFTSFAESVANSATSTPEPAVLELDENTSANLQNKIDEANDSDALQINSDVDMQQVDTFATSESEPKVLELDDGTSTDLKNKINEANDGDTIQINATITMEETVVINKSISLRGSGSLLRNHTNGPIIKVESPGKLTMEEITIDGNKLSNKNAAVEVSENSEFTMKSGTITKNTSTDNGGGIDNKGTVTINGGTITKNTAERGGGICNNQGTVTIISGEIRLNTASPSYEYDYGYGGGIYNSLGNLIISGGTITKNTASSYGGGICNYRGTITISNGEISANATSPGYGYGGGIYNSLGNLIIGGGTITKNTTSRDGGGIYNSLGTVTISDGEISANTAYDYGGCIYNTGTVTINGGTITGNTATDGGGIFNDGTVTISGGTITGNSVGGIYNNGTLTMSGGTVTNNEKCGVYVCEKKQFKVKGSAKVIDNSVNKKNNVIFASEDGYIIIDGKFTGLIKLKHNSFNKAVVKSAEGYNITQSDLSCFETDSDNHHLNLIGNEIIYMKNKTNWEQMVRNKGVTYYVDENGKASAEVGGNGRIWLNTKADGSGIWYCIDNGNGLFRTGSRFYVQVIDDISKYYDKIGSEYKDKIEDGKLTIFLIGVTDPDGNEYTTLDSDLTCYVKIDPNWDKDKLSAIFINGEMTEKIDVEYAGNIEGPSSEDKFAKLVIKHFSPYAIYQAKSNDAEVTQMDTNANSINTNDSNLKNSLTTGENINYVYILSLWAASIIALSGIVILKRKFNK